MPQSAQAPFRLLRYTGPIAVAITFVSLLALTWLTWPDVFVDFGREIYLPMRISEGAVLYRDLAYFNGPLSPYFNALCLKLFGASLHVLFRVNIVLLALLTTLLYRLLARIGDRFSALLGVLAFLSACAFAQLTGFGNYNFVAPYSHELTHGILLGVAALSALARWTERGGHRWIAVAGTCIGLASLTKPETAAAVLAAGALVFILQLQASQSKARSVAVFASSIMFPPILAAALLALAMPLPEALAAVARPWTSLGSGETMSLAFYRKGMGFDAPLSNIMAMLARAACWALAFLPAIFVASRQRGEGRSKWRAMACFALYALVVFGLRERIDWDSVVQPLPLFVGAAVVFAAWHLLHAEVEDRARYVLAAGFAMLAFVLLGKMLLNARVSHYGFALAFPGMMVTLTLLGSWLPAALDRRGCNGNILRGAVVGALAVFASMQVQTTVSYRAEKTEVMGAEGNAFRADIRGRYMKGVLGVLSSTPPDSTVAAIPEGALINVLAKRRTSLRFVSFLPPEVLLFGEDNMLADLEAHPPDRIVLVQKDTSEYGLPYFGRGYGAKLMAWMHANYHPEALVGDPPFAPDSDFGLLVLARNEHAP
jgi:hypothetical protein